MAIHNTHSNYQQRQQHETLQSFDKMTIDLPWHYTTKNKCPEEYEEINAQNLSQKMSQLSMSGTINKTESLFLKDINVEIEKTPNYLTKRNKSLEQMIQQALSSISIAPAPAAVTKYNNADQIEELRQISISIYKMRVIQTYHRLWTVHLKSGLGQLIIQNEQSVTYSTNVPIWSKEIQTFLQTMKTDMTADENEICLNFVHHHLHELDNQLKNCQTEWKHQTDHFQGYTLTIQKMIETYIEQNLQGLCMEIEHKIELIYYDYHIRALKLEYFRHQPNEYQKQLMKEICQNKYEQEFTEQEYNLLQQQIAYYNLPSQSFQSSPLAHSPLIESIQDPVRQQQLFKQYQEVAEQGRAKMFHLYIKTAEVERIQARNKYDTSIKKMWSDRQTSVANEQLPFNMIDLIHARCNKISQRIQCLYKFKAQSIGFNAKVLI